MKNLAIIVFFLSIFSSCTKDNKENTSTANYHGKWTLVKMSGSMFNSQTTGNAMEWQEFYIFSDNDAFTKIRIRNNVHTTLSGTYIVKNNQNGIILELTYRTSSEIIGSCYGNQKEELYFSDKNTLSSTWQNCDGPGLDYQKVILY